ncbi:phosphatidylglycerophosphatase A family protein [Methylobacillus glycogenes]|uniref:phosphatidylglycerophosphatase A family protein n=1 Tax=Methylobacillus glycogenes TaxID=406 RepID=UPI00055E27CF|nr:phosphatidylglycerophosphatase A [Methylobacillus glycogenes]
MVLTTLPNRQFLLQHPAHFLALGFGSGLMPRAPGTSGTLAALPLFAVLMYLPEVSHLPILAALFLIGIPLCGITGRNLGVNDHGSIVWDEIVAYMLVLEFTPKSWEWWLYAFLLFRLFDIWKPFPIRTLDRKIHGGFGVMLDDLLAAIYAIAVLKGLQWWMMQSF